MKGLLPKPAPGTSCPPSTVSCSNNQACLRCRAPMETVGIFELKRDCGSTWGVFLYFYHNTKSQIQVLTPKPTRSGGFLRTQGCGQTAPLPCCCICRCLSCCMDPPHIWLSSQQPLHPHHCCPFSAGEAERQEKAPGQGWQGAITAQDHLPSGQSWLKKTKHYLEHTCGRLVLYIFPF